MAIKSWFKQVPSYIYSLLNSVESKEEMLGMKQVPLPETRKILEDANRIVAHAESPNYKMWQKEAWSKALSHIDAIQNPKATSSEVDFHRGALSATLNLLRISEQAREVKKQLDSELNQSVSPKR